MQTNYLDHDLKFLAGGGEMGKLIRQLDWAGTTLNSPECWPQSLRITLGILLHSRFPMFLWWGPELLCFYNDAYRPSLGENGKHPHILGVKAEDAWPEVWHIIKPLIDQVLIKGEATWSEDQLIPIFRNGKIEDVYWTFSHTPVNDESGNIGGILVICNETTEKIHTLLALEESKNELEFAIEATELGTWDFNPLTSHFSANERLKEWFGFPDKNEIDLKDAIAAVVERDRECVMEAIQKALDYSTGGQYDVEYTIHSALTQRETIVHAKGRAWFNDDQIAYRFNGTLEDVTAKTMARRKLEKTNSELELYRFIVDNVSDFVGICDMNFIPFYVNHKGLDLVGLDSFEQLMNTPLQEFLFPEDVDFILNEFIPGVMETGSGETEVRFRHFKTGETIWMLYNVLLIKDIDGHPEGLATVSKNISHQKFAELELRNAFEQLDQSRDKLNIVIEASGLGNWELNVQTNEVHYSDRYLDIFGYPKGSELTHQQILKHIHPEDLPLRYQAFEEAFQTGEIFYQSRIIRKDGALKWIEGKGKVFYDDEGQPSKLIGTIRDITNEKQITLEQKSFAKQLEKQVRERTQELQRKNLDLEKMNKELESFAYISSHDLQEPLRKIQTFATRIIEKEQHNLSDIGKDYFRRMQDSAKRMQTLIVDLLSYSRMNTAELKYEIVDLNVIIEEVKGDLSDELEAKHATIDATHMCHVRIIPFQFQQLLHNLFTNSLKFASPDRDPHIVITSEIATGDQFHVDKLDEETEYCHISISDNGIGFEQEYSDKIFGLFQRLHGKTEYNGTGIGLAIVKRIVENHNGVITATAEKDKGATFDIYFPAT